MQSVSITKYDFRIRTRTGAVVDNLSIHGCDELDAERKLRQMYNGCEILETRRHEASIGHRGNASYEDVMDLITAGRRA